MGIEPTSEAWEASILPLYDARSLFRFYFNRSLNSATILFWPELMRLFFTSQRLETWALSQLRTLRRASSKIRS